MDFYNGEFFEGKRHGEGIFTSFKSKTSYSGPWQFGKQNGIGEIRTSQGKGKMALYSQGKIVKWLKEEKSDLDVENLSSSDFIV